MIFEDEGGNEKLDIQIQPFLFFLMHFPQKFFDFPLKINYSPQSGK